MAAALRDWLSDRARYRGRLEEAVADLAALDPPKGGLPEWEMDRARMWMAESDERERRRWSMWNGLAALASSVGWEKSD